MGKKNWQSHLWGCPIKPLLGWHTPTLKEMEHMRKMQEDRLKKEKETLEKADKALKDYERKAKLHEQADKGR